MNQEIWNGNNLNDWVNYLVKADHKNRVRNHLTLELEDFVQFSIMKILKYTNILGTNVSKQSKAYIGKIVRNEVGDKYQQMQFVKKGKNNKGDPVQVFKIEDETIIIDENTTMINRPIYSEFQNILTNSEIKILENYAYDKSTNKKEFQKIVNKIRKDINYGE